jgi:hypothetical protein
MVVLLIWAEWVTKKSTLVIGHEIILKVPVFPGPFSWPELNLKFA